ncbi:hypothetical protein AB0L00_30060 [Actinoallomurus sp. NPDC052308]|uniref:hypothetical protein n=1 Tax=Actinoallomurus sp. NPDC052308 TaxID=3155530 RepID=UPI00343BAAD9
MPNMPGEAVEAAASVVTAAAIGVGIKVREARARQNQTGKADGKKNGRNGKNS